MSTKLLSETSDLTWENCKLTIMLRLTMVGKSLGVGYVLVGFDA